MTSRRVRPLADSDVPALRPALEISTRWYSTPGERANPSAMFDVKHRWVRETTESWGPCGQVLTQGDEVWGYVLYGPPSMLPSADSLPSGPVSGDAVLLLDLWLDPERRGGGLSKVLVQAMARDLITRRAAEAVEVYGRRRGQDPTLLPEQFLSAIGFGVRREHLSAPRLRMDLRATRSWLSEVEAGWERLVESVRVRTHEPATGSPAAGRMVRE